MRSEAIVQLLFGKWPEGLTTFTQLYVKHIYEPGKLLFFIAAYSTACLSGNVCLLIHSFVC